jgi:hypothetical protein
VVTGRPWTVRVVVPARDERDLLPACLTSLAAAVAHVVEARPGTVASVTLVLDRCVDDSAAVAARFDGIDALTVDHGSVGAARAAGVRHATRTDPDDERVWVANTDADCAVPVAWLTDQLELADRGHQAVIGVVEPHGADLDDAVLAAWWARHERRDGHGHVHGANLGLTLEAYRAAGGFPDALAHEDVVLVERLRRSGVRWFAAGSPSVTTSGRREGRAPDGFAAYLVALESEEPTA